MKNFAFAAILFVCLVAYFGFKSDMPDVAAGSKDGAYTIITSEGQSYLLNKKTGQTWQYRYLMDENLKPLPGGRFWAIIPHFKEKSDELVWQSRMFSQYTPEQKK